MAQRNADDRSVLVVEADLATIIAIRREINQPGTRFAGTRNMIWTDGHAPRRPADPEGYDKAVALLDSAMPPGRTES